MNRLIYCPYCSSRLNEKEFDGRVRKYCDSCRKPVYENPVPATAAVCFNHDGKILLVKRDVEPKKNFWCLPGGFTEVDETPGEGCLRELLEETGLTGEIIGTAVNKKSESPFYSSVIVMGYRVIIKGGELKVGDDSSEVGFFNISNLPDIAFKSHLRIINHFIKKGRYDIKKDILQEIGAYVITSGDHISVAFEACKAGARVIQYRNKRSGYMEKLSIAKEIRKFSKKSGTLFIVNDSIEIALLSNADGVHLGQNDLSVSEVRKIIPENFIIGKSTHSVDQAVKAESECVDYIGIGPVFKTPTKKDYAPIGVKLAKEVAKKVNIPIVAIGGLNGDNIAVFRNSGIINFAMVREFQNDTSGTIKKINDLLQKN